MSWTSRDEAETLALGRRLATRLRPDGTLLLYGDLGAGKTALVRGLADGLGIPSEAVRSPTFTLMNEYSSAAGASLLHVDLYRLSAAEILALGLEERLAADGVKAVEWAERLPFPVAASIGLEIRVREDDERFLREVPARWDTGS